VAERDPAGEFVSPYVGMGNNPVNGVDPDGEWMMIFIITQKQEKRKL
jgi:hypothetical protein